MERRERELLDRYYRRVPMSGPTSLLATASVTGVDVGLIVVVVVLLVASALLALAETSLVRMSKAKAFALADEGRRGAKVLVRLVEDPAAVPQPGAADGPHLPAGRRHPGRDPGRALVRGVGRGRGDGLRDRR